MFTICKKNNVIQFYKTINKLLCNLSFAGQYINATALFDILIISMFQLTRHVIEIRHVSITDLITFRAFVCVAMVMRVMTVHRPLAV